MKKRTILFLTAVMAAISMTGCQKSIPEPGSIPGYENGEQYLSIWVHSIEDTDEGRCYREAVEAFNEAYNGQYFADIEFIPRNDSGGGYSDKINASVMSGGLPDVLTVDGPNVAAYAENGIIQPLAELTEEEKSVYLESILQQGTVNDQLYANTNKKAVTDFNLEINEKEFIAFVGPSGCGKSTTLRMIAGFEEISSGDLYIDGKRMNEVAPKNRGISMVFQNYALYPHMTVEQNIGYGLKNMKVPADEIQKKVDWAIKILGLTEYRNRKPKNLSGGQRQRVALGRAIVKDQKVFLMDEPLSNLDAKLRVSMRNEISTLHRSLGSTTIYVTHDQVEAMTMADRIVIMKDGVVQQIGKPMELYDHPVNKFVAGFIGSPQMNFFDITIEGNHIRFADGNQILIPDEMAEKLKAVKSSLTLGIRGEDIKFDAQNLDKWKENKQKAVITNTEIMGNENNLYFEFGGTTTVAKVSMYDIRNIGEQSEFVFNPQKMHFFDNETENAIEL